MKIQWRNCSEVEAEHRKDRRQYAHTYHYANTICVCRAFWELPKPYRDGVLLHEIGHLLAGPDGGESDANEAAREFFGVPIKYVDSPYGRELERISNMPRRRRRRNPEEEIPFGEWVPVRAVMFNDDGTVSVETEPGETVSNRGRRRNPYHYSMYLSDGGRITSDAVVNEYERLGLPVPSHLQRVLTRGTSYSNEDFDAMHDAVDELSREHGISRRSLAVANPGRRRNVHYGRRGELEYVPQRLLPELMNLWHLSKTATDFEVERIDWTVDEFHNAHPELTHSQIFRDLNAMVEG